jgi:hypothetical protein
MYVLLTVTRFRKIKVPQTYLTAVDQESEGTFYSWTSAFLQCCCLNQLFRPKRKFGIRYEQTNTPKNEKTLEFWQGAFFLRKKKKKKRSEERELALDYYYFFVFFIVCWFFKWRSNGWEDKGEKATHNKRKGNS